MLAKIRFSSRHESRERLRIQDFNLIWLKYSNYLCHLVTLIFWMQFIRDFSRFFLRQGLVSRFVLSPAIFSSFRLFLSLLPFPHSFSPPPPLHSPQSCVALRCFRWEIRYRKFTLSHANVVGCTRRCFADILHLRISTLSRMAALILSGFLPRHKYSYSNGAHRKTIRTKLFFENFLCGF